METKRTVRRPWVQILALLSIFSCEALGEPFAFSVPSFPVRNRVVMKMKYMVRVMCLMNSSAERRGGGHQGRVRLGIGPGLEGGSQGSASSFPCIQYASLRAWAVLGPGWGSRRDRGLHSLLERGGDTEGKLGGSPFTSVHVSDRHAVHPEHSVILPQQSEQE